MIQRIQSVYLLLGSLAVAAPLYFRSWVKATEAGSPTVDLAIQVGAGLAALLGLVVIFLYNDRNRQYKSTLLIQILTLLVIAAVASALYLGGSFPGISGVPMLSGSTGALVLPVLAYVFFFLGRRAIKSDIELIKSQDRLR